MKKQKYIPRRGDLVWLDFSPQSGHEQAGRRPALAISPETYNRKTGLAIFCPITSQIKKYPFEVLIETGKICGAILADQLRNLDWQARRAELIQPCDKKTIHATLAKIKTLIDN